MTIDTETDVLVVGGGMAGLVAAVEAVEAGAAVTVLEKGTRAGGSMYLSNGVLWTYETFDVAREAVPNGDAALQELVVTSLDDDVAWLDGLGFDIDPLPDRFDQGTWKGGHFDSAAFTEFMVDRITDGGGALALETPVTGLERTDRGFVVTARDAVGESFSIDADAVVLATGGFQGNEQLVEQHITDDVDALWLRSNPWSTGDGILVARDVGAQTTRGWGRFYGHNLAAPPAEFSQSEFADASQYYGAHAVALDRNGDRFTDESESPLEDTLAQDTARLADGRAYYVVDGDLAAEATFGGHVGAMVDRAEELGGQVARADSLGELPAALSEWEVNGERAVETIREFNDAVRNDRAETLVPPRRDYHRAIDTPPFAIVAVQPGITFTMGGLDVTERMAVRERGATASNLPHPADVETPDATIDGLYAAGVDVGNVNNRHYLGGLSVALVTGRIAGREAAMSPTDR